MFRYSYSVIVALFFESVLLANTKCPPQEKGVHVSEDHNGFPSGARINIGADRTRLYYRFDEEGNVAKKRTDFQVMVKMCIESVHGERFRFAIPSLTFSGYAATNKTGRYSVDYRYSAVGKGVDISGGFSKSYSEDFENAPFSKLTEHEIVSWSPCLSFHSYDFIVSGRFQGKNTSKKRGEAKVSLYNARIEKSVDTKFRIQSCD